MTNDKRSVGTIPGTSNTALLSQYLAAEGVAAPIKDIWPYPERQRVSALCFVEKDGYALMLRRKKEPFSGLWTAPGGKLEAGETPYQAIIREIREETQLELVDPCLQLIVSETGPNPAYNWLLFIYRCPLFTGALGQCNEGELQWLPVATLSSYDIADADRQLLPLIFGDQRCVVYLVFNEQNQVASMKVMPISLTR